MITLSDAALRAYEATAEAYDSFTAHHDYARWTEGLLRLCHRHGLQGKRLLDVGCGTGKSLQPLHRVGWDVVGCDLSAAMLHRARGKLPEVALHLADARDLPVLGAFDLVWALDDVANYLLDEQELAAALAGMAANLADGGRVVFDVNTLTSFRSFFAQTFVVENERRLMVWRGCADARFAAGEAAEATLDGFFRTHDGYQRTTARHVQRHHPVCVLERALHAAELECLAVYGQFPDVTFERPLDELRHSKAIVIATKA